MSFKKLQERENLGKNPSLVLFESIEKLIEKVDNIETKVNESREILLDKKKLKELLTPVYGVDYLTEKELDAIIKLATPQKGVAYFDGQNGEPGKNIKGDKGEPGKRGEIGPAPDHEIKGTKIRFKSQDGWGDWIDTKGNDGKDSSFEYELIDKKLRLKINDEWTSWIDFNVENGKDGYTPIKGKDYFDGKDGYTPIKGKDYDDGEDGYTPVKGVNYFDGEKGEQGEVGPAPKHEWEGSKLRFELPNGKWGKWVDLGTGINLGRIFNGLKTIKKDNVTISDTASVINFENLNVVANDTTRVTVTNPYTYPALTGEANKKLSVKGDESGVEWTTDATNDLTAYDLQNIFKVATATSYMEITTKNVDDDPTLIEYWDTSLKGTKLYTKEITYTSGNVTKVVITDLVSGKILTKDIVYDVNGDFLNKTITLT